MDWEIRPHKEAVDLYLDEYRYRIDQIAPEMTRKECKKICEEFDVYGLFKGSELAGCLMFEPREDGYVFHIAVRPEHRGKWSFYWDYIRGWMLEKYVIIYGIAPMDDKVKQKLLPRSGFKLIGLDKEIYWYQLWA